MGMGKTIVAEESLQDKLTALAKAGNFQIGLLIGQSSSEKDFIAHLAPTPTPDEGDLSSEEDEVVPKADHAKSKAPDSIAKLIDVTVSQHARQVIRMLPGGLDIIGIYVVTPQGDFNSSANQSKLRSILGAVHRLMSKILLGNAEEKVEKTIMHVCTQTFKIMCKVMEVSIAPASALVTADLKFQRGGVRWQQLSYTYNINLNFWLPKDKVSDSLYKMILTYIKPWVDSVSESLILIDSELPNDDDLLDADAEEKPTKKKGGSRGVMELAPPKVFNVEILDSCKPLTPSEGKRNSAGSVRLNGAVAGIAFVHSKATVREARAAVMVDLVRSVISRWEMHCDSLIEEPPSHLVGPIIHEPPRRVFLEGGGLPVSLCDYLFPGDTNADACQSATELLGVKIRDEHVDDSLETFKEVEAIEESNAAGDDSELSRTTRDTAGVCSVTHIVLAVAIGVIGIGFSYFSLQGGRVGT